MKSIFCTAILILFCTMPVSAQRVNTPLHSSPEEKQATFFRTTAVYRFYDFLSRTMETVNTPSGQEVFMAKFKAMKWIDQGIGSAHMFIRAGHFAHGILLRAAQRESDSVQYATMAIKEMSEFVLSSECTLSEEDKTTAVQQFQQVLELYRLGQQYKKSQETFDFANLETFKTELKTRINQKNVNVNEILTLCFLGTRYNARLPLFETCGIPAEGVMNELIEFLQSPECLASHKEHFVTEWKKVLLTAFGSELKLWGRTLENEEFDWAGLRGKYVLVQFTATWYGACHMQIPGMKDAYVKYRNKGFEIVSIYIFEQGENPVATIQKHVKRSQLPWTILSETLTTKTGQSGHAESFGFTSVPQMLLVDEAGKIIMTDARGGKLQNKLAEIFE